MAKETLVLNWKLLLTPSVAIIFKSNMFLVESFVLAMLR